MNHKSDILSFVAKCMQPEDITLSEINQKQNDTYYMVSCTNILELIEMWTCCY